MFCNIPLAIFKHFTNVSASSCKTKDHHFISQDFFNQFSQDYIELRNNERESLLKEPDRVFLTENNQSGVLWKSKYNQIAQLESPPRGIEVFVHNDLYLFNSCLEIINRIRLSL